MTVVTNSRSIKDPWRIHLYRWMGSVHAIIYGVTQGVQVELVNGRQELARRIDAPLGA